MEKTLNYSASGTANMTYHHVYHEWFDEEQQMWLSYTDTRNLLGSIGANVADRGFSLYWHIDENGHPVLSFVTSYPIVDNPGMQQVTHDLVRTDIDISTDGIHSCSGSASIAVKYIFDVDVDVLATATLRSSFHRGYTDDWNPFDRTPDTVGPIHTIKSATFHVEMSTGELSWSTDITIDIAALGSNYAKYGFDSIFSCGVGAGSEGTSFKIPLDEKMLVGMVSGSGFASSIPSGELHGYNDTVHITYGGSSLNLYTDGTYYYDTGPSGSMAIYKAPYTVNYSGTIKNIDGTAPGVAAIVETVDGVSGSTDANGSFAISKSYQGHYHVDVTPGTGTCALNVSDIGPTVEIDGHELIRLHASIGNCRAMGEPKFPWSMDTGETYPNTDGTTDYSDSWYGASDRRLTATNNYYNITDAVTFSAPTSKTLVSKFSAADWTVVQGAATITDTTDGIRVEVTQAPCRIKKAHTVTCAGARYADLVFTTTRDGDKDNVDVYLSGRRFLANPADTEIDLVSPEDTAPAVDIAQTAWSGSPTWGWGVREVGDIEFGNLQSNRVYTFKSLSIKRKSEFKVVLDGGTGARKTGTSGTTNSLGGPYQGEGDPVPYFSRFGYILVDGMVAAEIIGVTHYTIPSLDGDVWKHVPEKISNLSNRLCPSNGLVSFSYPNEAAGNCPVIYLNRGTYTSSNSSVSISAHGAGSNIAVPFNTNDSPSAGITKVLRAKVHILPLSKNDGCTSCKIRKYDKANGALLSEQTLSLDPGGTFSPALQCPTTEVGTISEVTDSTHFKVSGLSKDYTGYGCYLLSGNSGDTYYLYPQSNTILSHDTGTGAIVLTDALTGAKPDVDQKFWVLLDYQYKIIFDNWYLLCNSEGVLLSDSAGNLLCGPVEGRGAVAPRNTTFITALVA